MGAALSHTGSVARSAGGGSVSPLDKEADLVLDLTKNQPDLTLEDCARNSRPKSAQITFAIVAMFQGEWEML